MKHFLKGAAAVAITMIADIIIHVICNMNGIELNSILMTFVAVFCALLIYHGLTRNE